MHASLTVILTAIALLVYIIHIPSVASETCSFDNNRSPTCQWRQSTEDDFDWTRYQYQTPSGSVGTGPQRDKSGKGYYMYTEASGRKAGETAVLESRKLSLQAPGACVQFAYHMRGNSVGALTVVLVSYGVKDDGNGTEVEGVTDEREAWRMSHDQGSQWLTGRFPVPQGQWKIQIVGTMRGGFTGDMAIDNINVQRKATECEYKPAAAQITTPSKVTQPAPTTPTTSSAPSTPPEATTPPEPTQHPDIALCGGICLNGGRCQGNANKPHQCQCPPRHQGEFCETLKNLPPPLPPPPEHPAKSTKDPKPNETKTNISTVNTILISVAAVVVVTTIVAIVVHRCQQKRKSREEHKTSTPGEWQLPPSDPPPPPPPPPPVDDGNPPGYYENPDIRKNKLSDYPSPVRRVTFADQTHNIHPTVPSYNNAPYVVASQAVPYLATTCIHGNVLPAGPALYGMNASMAVVQGHGRAMMYGNGYPATSAETRFSQVSVASGSGTYSVIDPDTDKVAYTMYQPTRHGALTSRTTTMSNGEPINSAYPAGGNMGLLFPSGLGLRLSRVRSTARMYRKNGTMRTPR